MQVEIGKELRITNPNCRVMDYIKKNLVFTNPEYLANARMHYSNYKTPRKITLFRTIQGNDVDVIIPYGCLHEIFKLSDIDTLYTNILNPNPIHIDYNPHDLKLRPYQSEAIIALEKKGFGILHAPAGCGKTQIALGLIFSLQRRTLWITHTHELLVQSKSRALQFIDESLVGTIEGGKVDIGKGITFAVVNTLNNLDLDFYKDYFDVIIVDECHRVAGNASRVTMFSHVLNSLGARHKYGLTATPHRADGLISTTYALIGMIICEIPKEVVSDYIMAVSIVPCETGIELDDSALNNDGTINYCKLITFLSQEHTRNALIVDDLIQNSNHFCLILSDRIKHLTTLRNSLPKKLKDESALINGTMTSKANKILRERYIEDIRTGKLHYLFATYKLAKEGLDIPRLNRLFMATPKKDEAIIIQSIGRIDRKFQDKTDPIVYDYVDNIPYLKRLFKARKRFYNKENCRYIERKDIVL